MNTSFERVTLGHTANDYSAIVIHFHSHKYNEHPQFHRSIYIYILYEIYSVAVGVHKNTKLNRKGRFYVPHRTTDNAYKKKDFKRCKHTYAKHTYTHTQTNNLLINSFLTTSAKTI